MNANNSAGNTQVALGDYGLLIKCTISQYEAEKNHVKHILKQTWVRLPQPL